MRILIFSQSTSTMVIGNSDVYNKMQRNNFLANIKVEELKKAIPMSFANRVFLPLDEPIVDKVFTTATKDSVVYKFANEMQKIYQKSGKIISISQLVRKARKMGVSVGRMEQTF